MGKHKATYTKIGHGIGHKGQQYFNDIEDTLHDITTPAFFRGNGFARNQIVERFLKQETEQWYCYKDDEEYRCEQ